MKRLTIALITIRTLIRNNARTLIMDTRAEGYIDVLVKILITVVLGSLLLGLLKTAIPELFQQLIDKIKSLIVL